MNVVIIFLCILLIAAGLVLGLRKDPKLVRVGKSIECFAFILLNLEFFYNGAYAILNALGNISVVWKWLPSVISIGLFSICLLIVWKPFSGKKLRTSVLCLAGALVLLTVISSLVGTYNRSFIEDLASFVFWPAHFALAIVAFVVYWCFVKKQIAARIGISALCATPFALAWLIVLNAAEESVLGVGQPFGASPDIYFYLHPAIICIGGLLISLLFVWKVFNVKARRVTALCIAGAVVLSNAGIVAFRA